MTSSHTTGCGAWRIHHLTFPSLCPSVSHCGMSNLTANAFQWETVAGFVPHPLVPIVCSAALELAANQSQRLSYTNKHGIVASPRAGTQQSNQQFSQVIAGWRRRQSIPQTPSCLHSPSLFLSTSQADHQERQIDA